MRDIHPAPTHLKESNSGKYRMWLDDYGNLWCGGYCCAIVPIIDPAAG